MSASGFAHNREIGFLIAKMTLPRNDAEIAAPKSHGIAKCALTQSKINTIQRTANRAISKAPTHVRVVFGTFGDPNALTVKKNPAVSRKPIRSPTRILLTVITDAPEYIHESCRDAEQKKDKRENLAGMKVLVDEVSDAVPDKGADDQRYADTRKVGKPHGFALFFSLFRVLCIGWYSVHA
jgi:hypothetical protein